MPMSSSASTFVKPPFPVPQGFHKFSSVSRVSTRFCFLETKRCSSAHQLIPHRVCSTIGNGDEQLTAEPANEYIQSCDIVAFNKI